MLRRVILPIRIQPISPFRLANPRYGLRAASTLANGLLPRPARALKLRPYQEECVQTVLQAFQEGRRQVGVSLATGAGKTVIFTELLDRVTPQTPMATQTLILVHRRELVEQAARHCQNRYPDKRVEIEMGNMHASGTADITVASVQSITSRNRIDKFDPRRFKLILVDEAHHIVATTYLTVLDYFGLKTDAPGPEAPALMGVSATMSRFDGLALGKVIKHIVYHKDYIDMIGESWLSDVVFTTVQSHANLSAVKKSSATGDFLTSSLSKAVNTPETNLITVRSWMARASDRHSTIVFCVDLAHVRDLTEMFRRHGVEAKFVTGDTPIQIREERLAAFKNREFPVLLNCGVFTEGTDIPNIDCVLLARPTRSRNLLVQMIGRGMRLFPGKENCHIIDMVSSLESGIVTTPTLFGLDPDTMVELVDPNRMRDKKQQEEKKKLLEAYSGNAETTVPHASDHTVTFKDYDSVTDLISDTSGERHIRAISQYAWVHVGMNRFVLPSGGASGSYMTIEKDSSEDGGLWMARFVAKLDKTTSGPKAAPFMRPRDIARSETFEGVIRSADTFASHTFIDKLIRTQAPWRRGPASDGQLEYLNKHRAVMDEEPLKAHDLNKGYAGDMITKLIHGARGRWTQLNAAKRRATKKQRAQEEWEEQRKRETVQVGPLSV